MGMDVTQGAPLDGQTVSQSAAGGAMGGTHRLQARVLQTAGIAICFALLLGLLGSYVMLLRSGDAGVKQTDFIAYYGAAHLLAHGHGGQIYDFHAIGRFESALVHPLKVRDDVLPYVYPPYFAIVLAPLGALPYAAAYALWLLLNCLVLGCSIAGLQRYTGLRGRGAALLWLAGLSFLPIFVGLVQGQTSILLLGLFAAAVLALRESWDELAGVAVAFALIKPPYALPFLVVLLAQRRWRALLTFTAAALCLASLSALVLGPDSLLAYARTMLRATSFHGQFGYTPQLNHSFAGLTQLLLPAPVAGGATLLLDAGSLLALGWCALRVQSRDLPLGLAGVVALLVSPHVLIHDLTLLLIPVVVSLRYRLDGQQALTVLLVGGYGLALLGLRLVSVVPLQLSVLAMIGLGCWLLLAALRHKDEAHLSIHLPNEAISVARIATGVPRDATFHHKLDFPLEDF